MFCTMHVSIISWVLWWFRCNSDPFFSSLGLSISIFAYLFVDFCRSLSLFAALSLLSSLLSLILNHSVCRSFSPLFASLRFSPLLSLILHHSLCFSLNLWLTSFPFLFLFPFFYPLSLPLFFLISSLWFLFIEKKWPVYYSYCHAYMYND